MASRLAPLGTSSILGFVSSRPGWVAALVWLCACGEEPEPAWLLTDEPRVLAMRIEVVEPGPASSGLVPIPADRVRSQPLPGDTVEVSAWVVVGEEERPTEAIDPAWFLCPRTGGCVRAFERLSDAPACSSVEPGEDVCRLPDGERTRFEVPALDPELPLEEQAAVRLAMVGHADDTISTDDCLVTIADPAASDWGACVVAVRGFSLGPAIRLVTHAIDEGLEPLDGALVSDLDPVIPTYNPEVIPMAMLPFFGGRAIDPSRAVVATPGGTAVLETGAVYVAPRFWDPKDTQRGLELESTGLSEVVSSPARAVYSTTPGVLEFDLSTGWQFWMPDEPTELTIRMVLFDAWGGTAWTTYHFEVRDP